MKIKKIKMKINKNENKFETIFYFFKLLSHKFYFATHQLHTHK